MTLQDQLYLDVLLVVLGFLPLKDILNLRKTCRLFLDLTALPSFWSDVFNTRLKLSNYPVPQLGRSSTLSLTPHFLERFVIRALRFRDNWTSPHPRLCHHTLLPATASKLSEIRELKFVKHRGRTYLICIYVDWETMPFESTSEGSIFVKLKCWRVSSEIDYQEDIEGRIYEEIYDAGIWAKPGPERTGFFCLNSDVEHCVVLYVLSSGWIHGFGLDPKTGFVPSGTTPASNDIALLHRSYGISVLVERTNKELHVVDTSNGAEVLLGRSSAGHPGTHLHRGAYQNSLFTENSVTIFYTDRLEVYSLGSLTNFNFHQSTKTVIYPISTCNFDFRLLSCHLPSYFIPSLPSSQNQTHLSILMRSSHLSPSPSINYDVAQGTNGIIHYKLRLNPEFDTSMPLSEENNEWLLPPIQADTIQGRHAGRDREVGSTSISVGTRGTVLWRSCTSSALPMSAYAMTDGVNWNYDAWARGMDFALCTTRLAASTDASSSTSVLMKHELDNHGHTGAWYAQEWCKTAIDDEEGLVAVSSRSGDIIVLDYA